jgi:predicted O-methyltransferase YrrM
MKRLRESWERAKAVGLSDKGDVHSYLEIYDLLFAKFAQKKIRLLEIGVFNGGSLAMFKDYFPPGSEIHGIENQAVNASLDGVAVFFGNAYTDEMLSVLGEYDIIIDDGSHALADVQFFIKGYLDKVRPGGLLIVEDIQQDAKPEDLIASVPAEYRHCSYLVDCKQSKGRYDDMLFIVHKAVQ